MAHLSYWFVVAGPLALFGIIWALNRIMEALDGLLDDVARLFHSTSRLIARSKSSVIAAVDDAPRVPNPTAALAD